MSKTLKVPALHEGQREIYESPARYKVLACGRRWGKDTLMNRVMVEQWLKGANIAVLVPKDIDADKIREKHRELMKPLGKEMVRWSSDPSYVTFVHNGGIIRYYTAKNHGSIRGSGLDLVMINEAGELSTMINLEKAWERVIRPTLIDRQGKAWIAGTPRGITSFYRLFTRGLEEGSEWRSWQYSSFDNPYISAEEIQKMIEEEKLSEMSIAQEIYARFIDSEGGVFTDLNKVCILSRRSPDQVISRTTVIGVDVGLSQDYTAVSIMSTRNKPVVEYEIMRWRTPSVKRTAARLIEIVKEWRPIEVVIETNAVGEYLYEELADQLASIGVGVRGIYVNATNKADLIFDMRNAMARGDLLLVNDNEATAELSAFSAERRESGSLKLSAPRTAHDDTVIARALAYNGVKAYSFAPPTRQRASVAILQPEAAGKRKPANVYSIQEPSRSLWLEYPKRDLGYRLG